MFIGYVRSSWVGASPCVRLVADELSRWQPGARKVTPLPEDRAIETHFSVS
jgi:hypothetical protein